MGSASWSRRRTLVVALGVAGAVAVALTADTAASAAHRSGAAPGDVAVTVNDFRIDMPAVVHAGRITFVVSDSGPAMHELNIARTDLAADHLPVDPGGKVDDTTPHQGFSHIDEVEGIDIGQRKRLTVTLTPGTYVAYCNMDGHYEAGMHQLFTVVP